MDERGQIKSAREIGALLEIEGRQIKSSEGTIFVGCSDGDQFNDVYRHHCHVCEVLRHHPLLLNGGAMLLSKHSPIRGAKRDGTVFLRHINAASCIKHITTVVLYVHAPCGVARAAKLDFWEVMRLLVEAKLRLLSQRGSRKLKISCFCHVDFNGGDSPQKKRTYFVDREAMTELLKANGREVRF
ncbi:MAG TPA: hypothetical protein VJH94_04975 [Candidatus Paceibacterota bacterium]